MSSWFCFGFSFKFDSSKLLIEIRFKYSINRMFNLIKVNVRLLFIFLGWYW